MDDSDYDVDYRFWSISLLLLSCFLNLVLLILLLTFLCCHVSRYIGNIELTVKQTQQQTCIILELKHSYMQNMPVLCGK